MILLIDNYDSFVHNLARYLRRLGQQTTVVRNDAVSIVQVRAMQPAAIVLSPGPCTPAEAGISVPLVRELWSEIPILGVCLGHQSVVAAFGGQIIRAPEPMHGRTSLIRHAQRGVFRGIPNPVTVCRYHSLIADESTLPSELEVTARTDDGIVMGLQHRQAPVVGLQFHPEAVLTQHGHQMLANFLLQAGLAIAPVIPEQSDEWPEQLSPGINLPTRPVTF